jgi:hypothetical protein
MSRDHFMICWPIRIIGPGALLLVVSHLSAVHALVLWVGLERGKYKLGCEKYFAGLHIDHCLRCSIESKLGILQSDSCLTAENFISKSRSDFFVVDGVALYRPYICDRKG